MKRTETLRTVITEDEAQFVYAISARTERTVSSYLRRLIRADMERHRDRRMSDREGDTLPSLAMLSNSRSFGRTN